MEHTVYNVLTYTTSATLRSVLYKLQIIKMFKVFDDTIATSEWWRNTSLNYLRCQGEIDFMVYFYRSRFLLPFEIFPNARYIKIKFQCGSNLMLYAVSMILPNYTSINNILLIEEFVLINSVDKPFSQFSYYLNAIRVKDCRIT